MELTEEDLRSRGIKSEKLISAVVKFVRLMQGAGHALFPDRNYDYNQKGLLVCKYGVYILFDDMVKSNRWIYIGHINHKYNKKIISCNTQRDIVSFDPDNYDFSPLINSF